jgi:predicted transposase/invertase (TIGR01784 family)
MADEIHHPHDLMVRAVLSDLAEATSFLQRHLPQEVSQALNWSTLTLLEGSFVDEDLRASEADFLYEIERLSGEESVWVYVLLEHQSTPDRWMRFRLLKYCCRIWDLSFREHPDQRELRAIVPLVFYQGARSWSYSSEFADLFVESVRDWPGVPRFSHELVDQSRMQPGEIEGELKVRLMQLVMLAAYHPERPWRELVVELIRTLSSLPPSGGINYMRVFLRYILQTQDREAIESFQDVLQRHAPHVRGDLMAYAQELLAEGEEKGKVKGRIEERVRVIEGLLREGLDWAAIERVMDVNEAQFQALKQQVADMTE